MESIKKTSKNTKSTHNVFATTITPNESASDKQVFFPDKTMVPNKARIPIYPSSAKAKALSRQANLMCGKYISNTKVIIINSIG